jgi:hypothetical protein
MIGYFTAAGASPSTIDAIKNYSGDDALEDFFAIEGVRQIAQRSCSWDAIRACGADGDLAEEELATIHKMAGRNLERAVGPEEHGHQQTHLGRREA